MRAVVALLAGSAVAALWACVGDNPDNAGGPDAGIDAAPPDASTPPVVDSGPPDAPAPVDAADAGSFCTTKPTSFFCEDFDQGDLGMRGWSVDPQTGDAGPPSLVPTPTLSPPSALRSRTEPTGALPLRSRFQRTASTSSVNKKWTYSAEILLAKRDAPTVSTVSLFGFTLAAEQGPAILLQLRPDGDAECVTAIAAGSLFEFTLNQWHKVTLSAEKVGSSYTLECHVDQQAPASMAGFVDPKITNERKLTVGVVNYEGNGTVEVVYDNVVFDVE